MWWRHAPARRRYRRAILDAIGGFDLSFGAYLEDGDVELAKNATLAHLLRYALLIVLYDLAYVGNRREQPLRRRVQLTAAGGLWAALGRDAAVSSHGLGGRS